MLFTQQTLSSNHSFTETNSVCDLHKGSHFQTKFVHRFVCSKAKRSLGATKVHLKKARPSSKRTVG